jgi:hypothetical protein
LLSIQVGLNNVQLQLRLLFVENLLVSLYIVNLVAGSRRQVGRLFLLFLLVHVVDLRSLAVMLLVEVLLTELVVVCFRDIFLVRLDVVEVFSYQFIQVPYFVTLLYTRLFGQLVCSALL